MASFRRCIIHGKGVFAGLPQDFSATRYHSLVVERETLPEVLEITAETADGVIMGLQHKRLSGAWRAIPSREHRLRARPSAARQFPRSCPGRAPRAGAGPREAVGAL